MYRNQVPCLVLDAKYKLSAALEDLYQMISYCHALNLDHAVLIHPSGEQAPKGIFDISGAGNISVQYLQLDLSGGPLELGKQVSSLVDTVCGILKTAQTIKIQMEAHS